MLLLQQAAFRALKEQYAMEAIKLVLLHHSGHLLAIHPRLLYFWLASTLRLVWVLFQVKISTLRDHASKDILGFSAHNALRDTLGIKSSNVSGALKTGRIL